MSIEVPCNRCSGSGYVPMSQAHTETLALLEARPSVELSASDWARKLTNVTPSTMSMRLRRLEEYELIKSRRNGAERMYQSL